MKFFSDEVALYLYKSTLRPCMEYCCHVRASAPICYLELLDTLQKRICRTVGPPLAASLEPLAHRWNATTLSLFCRYYFGRCSSELAQLAPLPFSWGRSTRCSDRFHDFSVIIPRYYKDGYVNSFFPCTARPWNSVPIECFPLTYDLTGFKSRINRHLFNCRFFLNRFPVCHNLFLLLFLVTPCLVVAVQPCMESIPTKNVIIWLTLLRFVQCSIIFGENVEKNVGFSAIQRPKLAIFSSFHFFKLSTLVYFLQKNFHLTKSRFYTPSTFQHEIKSWIIVLLCTINTTQNYVLPI